MKFKKDFYKTIENQLGAEDFQAVIPDNFDLDSFEHYSVPYFQKYGYDVSNVYGAVYSLYNGIKSEKYLSPSLYYWYVLPYLNSWPDSDFYSDKNNYSVLFPDVRQAETVIKRQFGYYRNNKDCQISRSGALSIIKDFVRYEPLIIKPSSPRDSGQAHGCRKISDVDEAEGIVESYRCDFIVQRFIKCCKELSAYNESSCNTVRVMTLRVGSSFINLGNFFRFGSEGAFFDNVCAGGGTAKVSPEGIIDSSAVRLGLLHRFTIKSALFPSWNEVIDLCFHLHSRVPTMDFCGWDVTVDEGGKPVLVELNKLPGCESWQALSGPMFGEDLTDEIMEKIKFAKTVNRVSFRRTYSDPEVRLAFSEYNHNLTGFSIIRVDC